MFNQIFVSYSLISLRVAKSYGDYMSARDYNRLDARLLSRSLRAIHIHVTCGAALVKQTRMADLGSGRVETVRGDH